MYVHMFHRHGNKSTKELIGFDDAELEQWIQSLSTAHYSKSAVRRAVNDPNHSLNSWDSINQRLHGTHLCPTMAWNGFFDDIHKNNRSLQVQLTEIGALKLQSLGQWLRRRYIDQFGFLPPTLTQFTAESTLRIESSNFNRCIFSVDALLDGLYPMESNRSDGISIPIHIEPENNHFLASKSGECEWHKMAKKEFKKKMETMAADSLPIAIQNMDSRLCAAFKALNLGEFKRKMLSPLKRRVFEGMALPQGIDEDDVLGYNRYLKQQWWQFVGRDDVLRRTVGVLLGKLLDDMLFVEGHDQTVMRPRFIVSSGHDWTVMRMICCLLRDCNDEGLIREKMQWPYYGDHVIIEVWESDGDSGRFVRILHNRKVFPIHGMEFVPIEMIEQMWRPLIVTKTEWDQICCCN